MIVEYKRDMYRNYLVVLQEENLKTTYEVKMLQNNKILGFLPMQVKRIDGQDYYYYDVSSLQPCSELYQKAKLSKEQIMRLVEGIIVAIEKGKEYLLMENNFVLEPKHLFIDPSNLKVSLCYIPGYCKEIVEQFGSLLEFILDRVDYQEEQAVLLAYGLYKQNRDKTSTVLELKRLLSNEIPLRKEEKEEKEIRLEKQAEIPIFNEKLSPNKKEKTVLNKSSIIALCIGAILIGIIVIAVLYQLHFFSNQMDGTFETTKFLLFLILIILAEICALHFMLNQKNKVVKIKSLPSLIQPEFVKDTVPETIVYKHEFETIPEKISENTVLLLNETQTYGEELYCLLPIDYKTYQNILLSEFPFFIGKLKTNVDYAINHDSISRFHAKIEKEGEQFFLTDLNSTNGTFIQGKRLETNQKEEIVIGDQITFAQITYIFNKV